MYWFANAILSVMSRYPLGKSPILDMAMYLLSEKSDIQPAHDDVQCMVEVLRAGRPAAVVAVPVGDIVDAEQFVLGIKARVEVEFCADGCEFVVQALQVLGTEITARHIQEVEFVEDTQAVLEILLHKSSANGAERAAVRAVVVQHTVGNFLQLRQGLHNDFGCHRLSCTVEVVLIDVQVQEQNGLGVEDRKRRPLGVGVGDALRLAVAYLAQEVGAVGEGVHEEETDVPVFQDVVQVVHLIIYVGFAPHSVVAHDLAAAIMSELREMGDDHIGILLAEAKEHFVQGLRVEPVVGVQDLDILACSHGECCIDGGAVVAVGFVYHAHNARVLRLVLMPHLGGVVLAAIVDDKHIQHVGVLRLDERVQTPRQKGCHIVGGDDDGE